MIGNRRCICQTYNVFVTIITAYLTGNRGAAPAARQPRPADRWWPICAGADKSVHAVRLEWHWDHPAGFSLLNCCTSCWPGNCFSRSVMVRAARFIESAAPESLWANHVIPTRPSIV
jgi:hypothetical protein